MTDNCNGICLTGGDLGLPFAGVAYAHPTCPEHGDNPDHPFEFGSTDGHGHEYCKCKAVRSAHADQEPCLHLTVSSGSCFDCGWRP